MLLCIVVTISLLAYNNQHVAKYVYTLTDEQPEVIKVVYKENVIVDDYPGAAAVPPANQVQAAKFHKYALNATMTRLIFGALDSFAEVCDKANITYILEAVSRIYPQLINM